jgi:hypothetical protein
MTVMSNGTFRLSRIYAEGWNAANRLAIDDIDALDLGKLATLNPYTLEADRSRWTSGFTQALTADEHPIANLKARS